MKLVNFKLQTLMENLKDDNNSSQKLFKEYVKAILEDSNRSYFQKADYIGLSMQEIKLKIDSLTQSIKEFQELKKSLQTSLDLAKELTAITLIENGVDRIDGNIISSLTLTKERVKEVKELNIVNSAALMAKGFIKYSLDMEALEKALSLKDEYEEIKEYVSFKNKTTKTPAKIKVNTKRGSLNSSESSNNLEIELDVDSICA